MKKSKLSRLRLLLTDDAKTTRRCFGIDGKVGWGVEITPLMEINLFFFAF
jgi:hypothetical protein